VVRTGRKFDFWLVINETSKKWRPLFAKILRRVVTETDVFDTIYTGSPTVLATVKGLYPRCAGNCVLLTLLLVCVTVILLRFITLVTLSERCDYTYEAFTV
jgi:hypothetical protein